MTRKRSLYSFLPALIVAMTTPAVALAQQAPAAAPQARRAPPPPLFDDLLPHVAGERLRVDRMTLGDTSIPPHRRNGSAYLYVLDGSVRFQIEGQPEQVVAAGEGFFEPAGSRVMVLKSATAGTPATVLAVAVTADGQPMMSFN